jgi:hypothetical protein
MPVTPLTHWWPPEIAVAHTPTSWLCRHHSIRNTLASVPSPRSTTTGLKRSEVRITVARGAVHYRDRALGTVGVHVTATAAKPQKYSYNVSNALHILLRFTSTPIAPSIMSGGEGHIRSHSPAPLPVPPRHRHDSHRGNRARHAESERHRSHRRHDYDRSHGHGHDGEARVRGSTCKSVHHDLPSVCFSFTAGHPATRYGGDAEWTCPPRCYDSAQRPA